MKRNKERVPSEDNGVNNMKVKILAFFDKSFFTFMLIGAINTVLSLALQFLFYSIFSMGYWVSTSLAFIVCSVISFYFNKRYSFKNTDKILKTAMRFSLVIGICYLFAYTVAQPLSYYIISKIGKDFGASFIDGIAMLIGQIFFTLLNYTGQRFFAFK